MTVQTAHIATARNLERTLRHTLPRECDIYLCKHRSRTSNDSRPIMRVLCKSEADAGIVRHAFRSLQYADVQTSSVPEYAPAILDGYTCKVVGYVPE